MAGYGAAPGGTSYPLLSLSRTLANALTRPLFAFFASFTDIGSSNHVCGIERWTDGLKWGPSRIRDVSHLGWVPVMNSLLSCSMPPARLLTLIWLLTTHTAPL